MIDSLYISRQYILLQIFHHCVLPVHFIAKSTQF